MLILREGQGQRVGRRVGRRGMTWFGAAAQDRMVRVLRFPFVDSYPCRPGATAQCEDGAALLYRYNVQIPPATDRTRAAHLRPVHLFHSYQLLLTQRCALFSLQQ